jgi:hypothetical protein
VDGQAIETAVKLGRNNGHEVEVLNGLSEGDVIATEFSSFTADSRGK